MHERDQTQSQSLVLFEHNKRAYESALALMNQEGKAAVIHPTGTGKSFIAFRLAEEHPHATIIWLAPSEYIFQTQVENLRKALNETPRSPSDPGRTSPHKRAAELRTAPKETPRSPSDPGRTSPHRKAATQQAAPMSSTEQTDRILSGITFLTYSKLLVTAPKQAIPSTPDFIILDEFHRCGATQWEKSVKKLLAAYPDAKVLGLSATNVRYLDGQRDMAKELFDGCIASEMSLGEAVVKGILPMPKYVISLYSYKEELSRLRKRMDHAGSHGGCNDSETPRSPSDPGKTSPHKSANEKLFEELRRTLENAEGLPEIFQKHMRNPDGSAYRGKYIVFCADRQHMDQMMDQASEWFSLVDREPHIYGVYFNNPQTSRDFSAFQEDESDHLRLLFCINMLNEGVHMDGIDGVILLRPTVSPIIYLQQIGRALASKRTSRKTSRPPLIFDIVNNFESLYMIDTFQMEIEEACAVMGVSETERKKFQDYFHIYEEIKNCRELFSRINQNLNATWELYYQAAETYYREHGNLHIVKSYVTDTGLTVGTWLATQRRIRQGKVAGKLTEEQIRRLDLIGMEWESGSERKWRRGYEALKEYVEKYGNAEVKADYVTEDGYFLGKWVSNLRSKWRRGEFGSEYKEQQRLLEELGMIWDKHAYQWEVHFHNAEQYFFEHGNLNAPRNYRSPDGSRLGIWLDNQRQIYAGNKKGAARLSRQQIRRLEQIGMIWRKTVT